MNGASRRLAALAAVLFLAAARYDPEPARGALRLQASQAHNAFSNASGLALEPAKAPAIAAGLDEGLRLAALGADAARELEAGAAKRGAELDAAAEPSALKSAREAAALPLAAARRRWDALGAELAARSRKAEGLDEKAKKAAQAPLERAAAALRSADDRLKAGEAALRAMEDGASELRDGRKAAGRPLVELSSACSTAASLAAQLPARVAEAKPLLLLLDQEPKAESRAKAARKVAAARDLAAFFSEASDRAVNRADELRARSSAFDRAVAALAASASAAAAAPGRAKPFLDEAASALQQAEAK